MENIIKNILITDRKYTGEEELIPRILIAIETRGVDCVLIREKDLSATALFTLSDNIFSAVKSGNKKVKVIINNGDGLHANIGLDIAKNLGLDGVHFPESFLSHSNIYIDNLRCELKKDAIFGFSTHSLDKAKLAEFKNADYITFSPIFHTLSKEKYGDPQGIKKLAECSLSVNIPVIALGGITKDNTKTCFEAGAKGIAAIKYFLNNNYL